MRGSRLRKEALYVKVGGKNIAELVAMSVDSLMEFFGSLVLDEHDAQTASRVLVEIRNRLAYLSDVGLGYLTLDRLSSTLSGGESQRINLATSLGSNLTGSLYILDEPTTGLHFEDIRVLMNVLNKLVDKGNTVIVIEHNLDVIKMADYIIDMGPEGGKGGGELLSCGTPEEVAMSTKGYTPKFLKEELHL